MADGQLRLPEAQARAWVVLRPAAGSDSDQAAAGEEAVAAVADRLEEALLARRGFRVPSTRDHGGAPTGALAQGALRSLLLLQERQTSWEG